MSDFETVSVNDVPKDAFILDVREDFEWEAGRAAGATHVVLGTLPERVGELDPDVDTYVICRTGGRSAQDLAPSLRVIGIQQLLYVPLIAWIAVLCFVGFSFIMGRTPFGRHITLIGGNAVAAFRAGIKVDRLMFIAFIIAGAVAGLAGWLLAIRTSGATANLGTGMLFNAFAAVVIGGVSLKGGVGKLPGVYAGVLLLSSIHTAINLMGLPAHYTQVILGLLVLAAVLLDTLKLQIRQRFA